MKTARLAMLLIFVAMSLTGSAQAALKAGVPAPPFTLTTTTGEKVSLSDYLGQIVILHFWKHN